MRFLLKQRKSAIAVPEELLMWETPPHTHTLGSNASLKASDSVPRATACGVLLSPCQPPHSATLPGLLWDSPTPAACPLSFLLPCADSPAVLGVEKLRMSGLQSHSIPAVVPSLCWASGIQLLPVLDSEAQELPSCLV